MKAVCLDVKSIQDQHLDMMISLAYQHSQLQEITTMLERVQAFESECDEESVQRTYTLFQKKMKAQARADKHSEGRRWLPRAIEIAACLVLALGIAAPIAIANVEEIRARVLKALVRFEEKYVEVGLVEEEAFFVPSEWRGEYYPTYIPDGYEFERAGKWEMYVVYENEDDDLLVFHECTSDTAMNMSNEGATISYERINGAEAMLIERDDGYMDLVWWIDDRFFVIGSYESRAETIKMAEGVRKIVK